MNIFESILLGAVQGLTEFVPISSSGHLILVREYFNINGPGAFAFDAILHLATALAVLIYFRKEVLKLSKVILDFLSGKEVEREDRTLLLALVLGTVPVALVAFLLESFIAEEIREPLIVIAALVTGSVVFWIAEVVSEKNRELTARRGFWTGIFQILALIPGISRSGITISGGLFMGLNREVATRFSFLLSFPIILGAGLKKFVDIGNNGMLSEIGLSLIIGSVTAFVFGLFSIHFMLKYLKNHSLSIFAVYRIILAIIVFLLVI